MEMDFSHVHQTSAVSDALALFLVLNGLLLFVSLTILLVSNLPKPRPLPSSFAHYAFTVSVVHIGSIAVAAAHIILTGASERRVAPFYVSTLLAFVLLPSAGGLFLAYLVHKQAFANDVPPLTPSASEDSRSPLR